MPQVNLTVKKLESLKPKTKRTEYWDASLSCFGVRVTPNGDKVFCIMYRINGKLRRMTLGEYPILKLADARDMAKDAFKLVRNGIDPVEEKKRQEEAEAARRIEGFTNETLLLLNLNLISFNSGSFKNIARTK